MKRETIIYYGWQIHITSYFNLFLARYEYSVTYCKTIYDRSGYWDNFPIYHESMLEPPTEEHIKATTNLLIRNLRKGVDTEN